MISWLFNSVSKEIVASIMYSGTATEIWQDLRERFAQKNGPRVFQLRRELMSLNQGSDSRRSSARSAMVLVAQPLQHKLLLRLQAPREALVLPTQQIKQRTQRRIAQFALTVVFLVIQQQSALSSMVILLE